MKYDIFLSVTIFVATINNSDIAATAVQYVCM